MRKRAFEGRRKWGVSVVAVLFSFHTAGRRPGDRAQYFAGRMLPVAVVLALSLLATAVSPAAADDGPASGNVRILVLADDIDPDGLERGHRVLDRAIAAVQEALVSNSFQVYDATATLWDFGPPRSRYSDDDLIAAAATVVPPVHVVISVKVFAAVNQTGAGNMLVPEVQIESRMLNVRSRRVLGTVELPDPSRRPLSRGCSSRSCIADELGDRAAEVGYALGETLAQKLRSVTAAPAGDTEAENRCTGMADTFIVRFRQFSLEDIRFLETELAAAGCFLHHSTIRSMAGLVEFSYDTTAGDARLARNLRGLIAEVGATGTVTQNGNEFDVVRTGSR